MNVMQLCLNDSNNISTLFHEIARGFQNTEHEIYYVFLTGEPSELPYLGDNVHLHYCRFTKKSLKGISRLLKIYPLIKLIKKHNIEAIIAHQFRPTYLMEICSWFVRLKQKISVFHGNNTIRHKSNRLFTHLFLRRNTEFVTVSQSVKQDLIFSFKIKPSKIHVIYNGVDVQYIQGHFLSRPELRKQWNCSDHDFVFGHVARLVPIKGQKYLLQAFALLLQQYKNIKLIIIGGGRIEKELHELAEQLNIGQYVVFTGALPEAHRYMIGFDTFILPSLDEGLGVVLLEAMVAKLPIIASNVGGIPEIVENLGMLVPAGDVSALKNAMQSMLDMGKEKQQEMGENLHQRLLENFTVQKFQEGYRNLIK